MASRFRSVVDSALTRVSPTLAAHLRLWRRTRSQRAVTWSGELGVDYREEEQLRRLEGWDRYAELFSALRADPSINRGSPGGPVSNPWFPSPDAEAYGAMIGDLAPRHVVEIGAGFSTRVARRAIDALGVRCRITVVDPSPRADVDDVADVVVRERIQAVDPARLPLEDGTLLFVDSSHVAVPGGDVPYVYGRIVPRLPAGAYVHAHDVFLPFEYPRHARGLLYNEQYLVHALLSSSPRYRVLLATHLLSSRHPGALARAIPGIGPRTGGSFWFAVEAAP